MRVLLLCWVHTATCPGAATVKTQPMMPASIAGRNCCILIVASLNAGDGRVYTLLQLSAPEIPTSVLLDAILKGLRKVQRGPREVSGHGFQPCRKRVRGIGPTRLGSFPRSPFMAKF